MRVKCQTGSSTGTHGTVELTDLQRGANLSLVPTFNRRKRYIVCIAGATMGSTGLLVEVADPPRAVEKRGPGIRPLELPLDFCYYDVRDLCNSLHAEFVRKTGEFPVEPMVTFALSGITPGVVHKHLVLTTNDSALGPIPEERVEWRTRGEACFRASGGQADTVVVKVGSVAFAHAFAWAETDQLVDCRVGGWGLLSGDDGGAYQIGRHVLYRLFQENDGREDRSVFSDHMAGVIGETNIERLTQWIRMYGTGHPLRLEVSDLARFAIHFAEMREDDIFCKSLLKKSASTVAHSCAIAATKVRDRLPSFGSNGIRIVLHGGVIQNSPFFTRRLCLSITERLAKISFSRIELVPLSYKVVAGCLLYTLTKRMGFEHREAFDFLEQLTKTTSVRLSSDFPDSVVSAIREAGNINA